MRISAAKDLTSSFLCYAAIMNWMACADEDFLDYNERIVPSFPFIAWLHAKKHISDEKFSSLFSLAKVHDPRITLQDVLQDGKLFPITYGSTGLGYCKAYALLADFISQYKHYRSALFKSVRVRTLDDSQLEEIPLVSNEQIKTREDLSNLTLYQEYTMVSAMSISECDRFFVADCEDTSAITVIESADDFKDPFLAFCVLMQNDRIITKSLDANLNNPHSLIAWLIGKEYIYEETTNKFYHSRKQALKMTDILQGKKVFPKTLGVRGLGKVKSCALFAEFVSESDIFRTWLYESAHRHKAKAGLKAPCVIDNAQFTNAPVDKTQLKTEKDLNGLTYCQLYTLVYQMSIKECDSFFSKRKSSGNNSGTN